MERTSASEGIMAIFEAYSSIFIANLMILFRKEPLLRDIKISLGV